MRIKHLHSAAFAVLLTASILPAQTAPAATATPPAIIYCVIDVSESMKGSMKDGADPENLRTAAVKLLCCLVPTGTRFGFLTFSDEVVHTEPIVRIKDEQARRSMLAAADNCDTARGRTDILTALKRAAKMVSEERVNNSGSAAIIFLTDGMHLERRSDKPTTEQIIQAVTGNENCPIYCIGLGPVGNIDQELLKRISKDTHGTYYHADTANKLLPCFQELGESIIGLAHQVPINSGAFNLDHAARFMTVIQMPGNSNNDAPAPTCATGNNSPPTFTYRDVPQGKVEARFVAHIFTDAQKGSWTLNKGADNPVLHVFVPFHLNIVSPGQGAIVDSQSNITVKVECQTDAEVNIKMGPESYPSISSNSDSSRGVKTHTFNIPHPTTEGEHTIEATATMSGFTATRTRSFTAKNVPRQDLSVTVQEQSFSLTYPSTNIQIPMTITRVGFNSETSRAVELEISLDSNDITVEPRTITIPATMDKITQNITVNWPINPNSAQTAVEMPTSVNVPLAFKVDNNVGIVGIAPPTLPLTLSRTLLQITVGAVARSQDGAVARRQDLEHRFPQRASPTTYVASVPLGGGPPNQTIIVTHTPVVSAPSPTSQVPPDTRVTFDEAGNGTLRFNVTLPADLAVGVYPCELQLVASFCWPTTPIALQFDVHVVERDVITISRVTQQNTQQNISFTWPGQTIDVPIQIVRSGKNAGPKVNLTCAVVGSHWKLVGNGTINIGTGNSNAPIQLTRANDSTVSDLKRCTLKFSLEPSNEFARLANSEIPCVVDIMPGTINAKPSSATPQVVLCSMTDQSVNQQVSLTHATPNSMLDVFVSHEGQVATAEPIVVTFDGEGTATLPCSLLLPPRPLSAHYQLPVTLCFRDSFGGLWNQTEVLMNIDVVRPQLTVNVVNPSGTTDHSFMPNTPGGHIDVPVTLNLTSALTPEAFNINVISGDGWILPDGTVSTSMPVNAVGQHNATIRLPAAPTGWTAGQRTVELALNSTCVDLVPAGITFNVAPNMVPPLEPLGTSPDALLGPGRIDLTQDANNHCMYTGEIRFAPFADIGTQEVTITRIDPTTWHTEDRALPTRTIIKINGVSIDNPCTITLTNPMCISVELPTESEYGAVMLQLNPVCTNITLVQNMRIVRVDRTDAR